MTRIILALFLAAQPAAVAAQSLSADDIRAMVDQRVASLDPYRALLEDPDDTRAMAAMDIMMGSGDADLRRMALEYGLYSPSAVVRRAALDAFFDTGPILTISVARTENANQTAFASDVTDNRGSIGADGIGHFPLRVGAADAEQSCFLDEAGRGCLIRNSDAGVMIFLFERWWQFQVDEEGRLIGSGSSQRRNTSMSAIIPVAF